MDIENLSRSVHGDGFSVIDKEESLLIKQTRDAHVSFIMSRKQSALIAHILGERNIALMDALAFKANIRECEIN